MGGKSAAPRPDVALRAAAADFIPPGSNWRRLQERLASETAAEPPHNKRRRRADFPAVSAAALAPKFISAAAVEPRGPFSGPTRCLALDCEMVGVGPTGRVSALSRVSVVK